MVICYINTIHCPHEIPEIGIISINLRGSGILARLFIVKWPMKIASSSTFHNKFWQHFLNITCTLPILEAMHRYMYMRVWQWFMMWIRRLYICTRQNIVFQEFSTLLMEAKIRPFPPTWIIFQYELLFNIFSYFLSNVP